jgi:hypothetical protein
MTTAADGKALGSDKEMVMSGVVSRMRGGLLWGLAAGIVLLMAGDHAQTASPANTGIDPFEILDLQVRPNVIIVLDSSGSMREFTAAATTVTGINNGDLVGDDSNAKMSIAKGVLRNIVNNNKGKVNFQFGKYQGTTPTLDGTNNYIYRSTNANAATLGINAGGNGSSAPGIKRDAGSCTGSPAALPCTGDNVAVNGVTYYYVVAQRFWNGETVHTGTKAITPATPTKTNPATVTLTNGTISVTFTLMGPAWNKGGGGTCTGFQSLVALGACTQTQIQFDNIDPYLGPEVAYNADGSILLNGAGTAPSTTRADGKPVGIRAGGLTPIANTISTFRTNFWTGGANYWGTISAKTVDKRPKTIFVFVTDGDDTCAGGADGNANARLSAIEAQNLYAPQMGGLNADGTFTDAVNGPTSSVSTFFIAFGNAATANRSNWIAWGGSGLNSTAAGFNWTSASDATLQAKRDACITCEDALSATNAQELEDAIQNSINRGVGSGEFSSQSQGSVTDSVLEYVALASVVGPPAKTFDPLDPISRFGSNFPITVRSTFVMPAFDGQLKAYKAGSATPVWDAGQVLKTNVINVMGATQWTFAQLHGSSSVAPYYIPATTAKIRRRIFTTSRNGVSPLNVPLWPPTTDDLGVAPSNTTTYPAGTLDGSGASRTGLAIGGLTFAQLQTQFKACQGTNLPADCALVAKQVGRATKEAREIILAYTAGAKVVLSAGLPVRNGSGEILYTARTWLLAESTIATPAIVGPPGELPTVRHGNEWLIYRDGPRDISNRLASTNSIENGFGLRNPDRDDSTASTAGEQEPVMTVVYVGANDMLHAFRAGPQGCTASACPTTGKEGGGEELWGFVPYDLLPVLKDKRPGQSRLNPVYMISSSLRIGDVFVPGTYTAADNKLYNGKWRTLMFFGRGPGGKNLTGMDITGPGPFTRKALETKLPSVLWNRGNPDTQDGTAAGASNVLTNASTDLGATDSTAFATLGETWSVPALVPVDVASASPADTFGKEWVLWAGSGFSDVSTEGRNFYTIDAVTGDILRSVNVGSALGAGLRTNFLNASPTGFVPSKLVPTVEPNAADGPATAVFVGDLHGRMFRLSATDLNTATVLKDYGTNQPIGVAVSALDLNTDGSGLKPHVYGVTGADNRIFDPKAVPPLATPPFQMFGLRDDGAAITELFAAAVPPAFPNFPERFRGSTQPLVAKIDQAAGNANIVFFIGTQFDPAGTSPDPTADPCISSFDTIFFAVNAFNGNAAFDLQTGATDDRSAIWRGQKVQNITARGGKVVLDTGLLAGAAPPPPPPPAAQSNNAYPSVFTTATRYGSPVCKW